MKTRTSVTRGKKNAKGKMIKRKRRLYMYCPEPRRNVRQAGPKRGPLDSPRKCPVPKKLIVREKTKVE